jgi:protease-4
MNAGRTPRLLGERGGDNVVAVLYLEGEIVDGWGDLTNIGGDRFAAELRELRKDDDVKAVVLRVNSPGGSAYASEVIQREIIELKAKKPVIVSMGNYAASGGYWVSTYADHIFAEPNTLTGSIGVFGMFLDIQKLGNDFGVTWDTAQDAPGTRPRPVPRRRSLRQVSRQGFHQPQHPARHAPDHRPGPRLGRPGGARPETRR